MWHLSFWSLIKPAVYLEASPLSVMGNCSVLGRLQSYCSELCFWCAAYWWVIGVPLMQQAVCLGRDTPSCFSQEGAPGYPVC